jgi:hypothetical protein
MEKKSLLNHLMKVKQGVISKVTLRNMEVLNPSLLLMTKPTVLLLHPRLLQKTQGNKFHFKSVYQFGTQCARIQL